MPNDVPISDREREILRLVATGATNQQIAQQLSISINTVKVHLRNIFGKIGVVSRTEATVYAISSGLVLLEPAGAGAPPLVEEPPDADDLDLPEPPAELAEPAAEPAPPPAVLAPPPAVLAPTPATLAPPRPPARRLPLLPIGLGLALLLAAALGARLLGQPAAPSAQPAAPSAQPAAADPDQRWFVRAPMPNPRDGFAVAAYDLERKLYVIGGQVGDSLSASVDRYDPEGDLWVSLGDKPTAVSQAGAVSLGGRIYMPGGEDAGGAVSDLLEAYDPRGRSWERLAPLPQPRSRYALVAFEGRLYVIGGWDGRQARAEVYSYDPKANSWADAASLPAPRQYASATVASGRIYLLGGEGAGGPLRDNLRLDPTVAGGGWDSLAPLPQPIGRPSATSVINTLLIFDAAARAAWQYDQAADAWQPLAIPADAVIAPSATLLDSSIYFLGDRAAAGALGEYRVIYTTFVPGRGP